MAHLISRVLGEVRVECASPEPQRPTDDLIIMKMGDVLQGMHTQALLTPHSWSVSSYDLPAQAGKAEYLIPHTHRFGKPQHIHTLDSNDPQHVNRTIPIIERQNASELSGWPGGFANGAEHSAEAMFFYFKDGAPYLQIVPTPQAACKYRVWFEVGEIPEPILDGVVPGLAPFHRFARAKTSLLVLPYCFWPGLTRSEVMEQRRDLAAPLIPFCQQWERIYQNYVATSHEWGSDDDAGFGCL